MQIKQLFVFMRKLKFDCYNNITKVTKNNRAENLHFSKKCGLITTNCVFDKILTTKGSRIKQQAQMTGEYLNILQRNGKLILIAIKNVLLIVLNLMEQHRAMELSGPD